MMSQVHGVEETERIQTVLKSFQEKMDQIQRRSEKLEFLTESHKDQMEKTRKELEDEQKKIEEQGRKIAKLEERVSQLQSTVEKLAQQNHELGLKERVQSLEESIKLALQGPVLTHQILEFTEGIANAANDEFEKLNGRMNKSEKKLKRLEIVLAKTATPAGSPGMPPTLPPSLQTVPKLRISLTAGSPSQEPIPDLAKVYSLRLGCKVAPAKLQPAKSQGSRVPSSSNKIGSAHIDIGLPACNRCGKYFASQMDLSSHIVANALCWREDSTSRSTGRSHGLSRVNRKAGKFFCRCDKWLPRSKNSFIRHFQRYRAERNFGCPECDKRFLRESHLKRHQKRRAHTGNSKL